VKKNAALNNVAHFGDIKPRVTKLLKENKAFFGEKMLRTDIEKNCAKFFFLVRIFEIC
jgi:hypothetical protein